MSFELDKLLEELGPKIGIENLHVEDNTCLIRINGNILINLEADREEGYLIVGSTISALPPGRYKEDIFEAALRANSLNNRVGIFAYSRQIDSLILYDRLWILTLSSGGFAEFLNAFSTKVKLWQDAISRNDIPPVAGQASVGGRGIFGLRP